MTGPIRKKAEELRLHAAANAALAAEALGFDASNEGERLRRHELASGRGVARSLDTLLKLRRRQAVVSNPADLDEIPIVDDELTLPARSEDESSTADEMNGDIVSSRATSALSHVDGQPGAEIENETFKAISMSVDHVSLGRPSERGDEPIENATNRVDFDSTMGTGKTSSTWTKAAFYGEFRTPGSTMIESTESRVVERPADERVVDPVELVGTAMTPRSPPTR